MRSRALASDPAVAGAGNDDNGCSGARTGTRRAPTSDGSRGIVFVF
jgi:hypothetical protein